MSKNKLHLLVDVFAYFVMLALASTGLLLAYTMPPGTGCGHGGGKGALTLLGRSRHEWGDVHWYLAITLLVLVVLHIVLHWKWVTNTFGALLRSGTVKKAGAGAGGVVVLLGLGIVTAAALAAPWLITVENRPATGGGRGGGGVTCEDCAADCPSAGKPAAATTQPGAKEGHAEHGHAIRGKDSLAEAAEAAGVPVQRLIAELKLPANTDAGAQLGQLRRQHGFSMEDVRATVARLKSAPKPKQ